MKFAELRSPQLSALDRDKTLVVLPVAAVEQHGPHLPTGTDTLICTAVAEAVEARQPDAILLLPNLWLGASAHHLRFGATLTADLDSYIRLPGEILRPLLHEGYRRFMVINGHGGNIDPLRVALRQLQEEHPAALFAGAAYWAGAGDFIAETLEGSHKFVGHACEFETSVILHLRPDLVDTTQLKNAGELVPDQINGFFVPRDMRQRTAEGGTGRPDLASAEKGERLLNGIVDRVAAAAQALLTEPLPE